MSGNPFRASPSVSQSQAAAPPISSPNADSSRLDGISWGYDAGNASPQLPPRTKKSVRIESPPSSPPHPVVYDANDALTQSMSYGRHADSPVPDIESSAAIPYKFEHPAAAESSHKDLGEEEVFKARYPEEKNIGGLNMVGAVQSPTSVPANPFSRTLATIESQEHGNTEVAAQYKDRTPTEKAGASAFRGSLDVEGFKRLLMTGIPAKSVHASQPMTAPNPATTAILESNSSTSSVSRLSVFEPVQESHAESPRTSHEMALSDDDRVGLVADLKKTEKKKPLPPKHRHGRPVSMRAPQTVSFSDFAATESIQSPPMLTNKTNSDLNKPLPPPPVTSPPAHIVSQDITQDSISPLETRNTDPYNQTDGANNQKKAPPPVPLARRHSQLRTSTTGNRSRSNSALTTSSQISTEFPLLSPGTGLEPSSSPSGKAPPPPPPTRRHGASLTNKDNPSANSSTTELSLTLSPNRSAAPTSNPSSARRTTFTSQPSSSPVLGAVGLSRTSSVTSNRNVPRSVSNESSSSNMPPPPPPPRRRQSGRSSLDKERPQPLPASSPTESRRTSAEHKRNSLDNKRRTSVASESSLRYEYAPSTDNEHALYSPQEEVSEEYSKRSAQSPSNNILDDMEQFQKEIDALRNRYKPSA